MAHSILIAPIGIGTGSSSVCMGLMHKADQRGITLNLFIPVQQKNSTLVSFTDVKPAMSLLELRHYMTRNALDEALEAIVQSYEEQLSEKAVAVVLGLTVDEQIPFAEKINAALAKALDANVLLVATDTDDDDNMMNSRLEIACDVFGGKSAKRVIGCVINKAGAPRDMYGNIRPELFRTEARKIPTIDELTNRIAIFQQADFELFGIIPWSNQLISPRVIDIEYALPIKWIRKGDASKRRIEHITIGTRSAANLASVLHPGTLIVTGGDRLDVLHAAALAEMNGIALAGVILTGGFEPSAQSLRLITIALKKGLPVIGTDLDTYPAATRLSYLYNYLAKDDFSRYQSVLNHFAEYLDSEKIKPFLYSQRERKLSPAAFRYNLIKTARKYQKRIVLPEGDEPRTITAAITCIDKGIAHCILLADPGRVKEMAIGLGLTLPPSIEIIAPETIASNYIEPFVTLRKHKGMNEVRAAQLLEDRVVLGTMMLQQGDVDGLVSGAVHTTANTILPALQLIKTNPGTALVSSVFFMCLPDQVVVYGDCAINPDPTADELADIAIQSADSARMFGINPKVAMISYSTGKSGRGVDVEKVKQATAIAKQRRADLVIDGPLQYDAAANMGVARTKAPDSDVAGKATVFIFPDLNTGNTTYKAVQRSAGVISIGPMLQGLKKPVNDLSRGALIDDIIYTIALTAIQACDEDTVLTG